MKPNRREWLLMSRAASGGFKHPARASALEHDAIRLSLNENPFCPSALVARAIGSHLDRLSRYTGDELTEFTNNIAARENVAAEQIVLGEISVFSDFTCRPVA